jgi:hypothetical protein
MTKDDQATCKMIVHYLKRAIDAIWELSPDGAHEVAVVIADNKLPHEGDLQALVTIFEKAAEMKLQDVDLMKFVEIKMAFGLAVRKLYGLNVEELKSLMAKITKSDFVRFNVLASKNDDQGVVELLNEIINGRPDGE